jgi:hypothetical protein
LQKLQLHAHSLRLRYPTKELGVRYRSICDATGERIMRTMETLAFASSALIASMLIVATFAA